MHARPVSFASLLLAAASPAFAESPPQTPAQTANRAPESLAVDGRWTTEVKDGKLVATLTVVNTGNDAIELLSKRGRSPGAGVQAMLGEQSLAPILGPDQMRDMMSRRGPMPTFTKIAPKKELLVGTYEFQLPEGYAGQPIELVAYVEAMGQSATLKTTYASAKPGV